MRARSLLLGEEKTYVERERVREQKANVPHGTNKDVQRAI